MPEGDTIHRTAATLRPLMERQRIERAESPDASCTTSKLQGSTIESVEARGKHLLIHLDCGTTIHSHMGMTGSWHIYNGSDRWQKPLRQASLVLTIGQQHAICFSPKLLELLTIESLRRHRWLSRLGPDVLAASFDPQYAECRFRSHQPKPIGEVIMDQTVVCGVGNVYKSELLFLERINPLTRVERLSRAELHQLLLRARRLMRTNLQGYSRRTRFAADGSQAWVYGRAGQACFKCGTMIRITRQGNLARTTYWCPTCQS